MHPKRTLLVGLYALLVTVSAGIAQEAPEIDNLEAAKRIYRGGDYRAAIEALERALATEESPEALYLIGYANLQLRDYEASREAFRRSFALQPDFDPRTIYQPRPE